PQEILRRVCGSLSGRKQGRILDKRGDKFIFVAAVNDDDDYQAELSVYWSHEREDLVFSKEDAPLAMQIRGAFGELSDKVDSRDMSIWLSSYMVTRCQAVRLRPSGGFYYIPENQVEIFRKL